MTVRESERLVWPREVAGRLCPSAELQQPDSNIVLDLHGDPLRARLAVFSDGNHHMALEECLGAFLAAKPEAVDVFYATTPSRILMDGVRNGAIRIGNLMLSIRPHVFIGPADILDQMVAAGEVATHVAFAESRGNVLLIRRGNPKGITGLADILRPDVRLALSNPETEAASHRVYRDTILDLAADEGQDVERYRKQLDGNGFVATDVIHHREIPQILADDLADVSVVYFHLALRYARIFGDRFEIVPLSPLAGDTAATGANHTTRFYIGLIGDGGDWGPALLDFMTGAAAAEIYDRHGLSAPAQ